MSETRATISAMLLAIKPRCRPVAPDVYVVTYRGHAGLVHRDGRTRWRCDLVLGEQRHTVVTGLRTCRDALARLVGAVDSRRACEGLVSEAEAELERGFARRLERLGGEGAVDAFQRGLDQLRAYDLAGAVAVQGMQRAVRKAPRRVSAIVADGGGRSYGVTTVRGILIALHGGPTYYLGDVAEHGQFVHHYFGQLTCITPRVVLLDPGLGRPRRRLRLAQFAWRNLTPPESKWPVLRTDAQHRPAQGELL